MHIQEQIRKISLAVGDTLLIQGSEEYEMLDYQPETVTAEEELRDVPF